MVLRPVGAAVAIILIAASAGIASGQELRVLDASGLTPAVKRFNEATGASTGAISLVQNGQIFAALYGMEFGPGGYLYVSGVSGAGNSCEIRRFKPDNSFDRVFVSGPLPGDVCDVMAFGPDGNIYTTGVLLSKVYRYNGQTGVRDATPFIDDPALQGSIGLAFGPDDNIYVSTVDSVRRYNGTTGQFIDQFVTPGSGGVHGAGSIVFGPDGHLYVSSYHGQGFSRVLRYNGLTGAFIDAFVAGTASSQGGLNVINGMKFGPDGNLYVTNIDAVNPSNVVRFDGKTGAFIDVFASGFLNPRTLVFTPRPTLCPNGSIADTDGDALLDCWERDGIDFDGDGTIDFTLPGANRFHKDKYIEVDWMENHQPDAGALAAVVSSFANAPVQNPDAQTGINLHILADEIATPHANEITFPPSCTFGPIMGVLDFDAVKAASFGTAAERAAPGAANILGAKRLAYHYALFAHSLRGAPQTTGCSEIPGNDFVITLASWSFAQGENGSPDQQARTFMHEFGHNLGLFHGGGDTVNCKPNYLSIMNYAFMYSVFAAQPLDYSNRRLPTLDVMMLNEPDGIGGVPGRETAFGPTTTASNGYMSPRGQHVDASGAINWNFANGAAETGVSVSGLTNFGFSGCTGSTQRLLEGHDDWQNLVYDFRRSVDFGDAVHQSGPEEIAFDELLSASPDSDNDGVRDLIDNCPNVPNPDQLDLNGNFIGDVCDPVNQPPTADAGPDQAVTVTAGSAASVTLSGTASDPNKDPLSFTWSESTSTLGQGAQLTTTLPVGAHTITLTVQDGRGGAATDTTQVSVSYGVCLLYDPNVGKKSGSTYPIKVQLCDASGRNLSSPSIALRATGVIRVSAAAPILLDDAGNANADFDFRYDPSLAAYMFNLKTTGYSTGLYNLTFTAGTDPVSHAAAFSVR